MRSLRLDTALTEFFDDAGAYLREEIAAGAEVPFELGSQRGHAGQAGGATHFYSYRALTGAFIAEREAALQRLPAHMHAAGLLHDFDGLDRYLASAGIDVGQARGRMRANAALTALLRDVFDEQTDFDVRPDRVAAALERLERSATAGTGEVMLVATLHGVAISSPELHLTKGLTIARPEAIRGAPEGAIAPGEDSSHDHLLVVLGLEDLERADATPQDALASGREVLKDLLRALRLFGDGRVTLGALAWTRVTGAAGGWSAVALGAGGRPHGMLVVTAEQEDELRAFCNLVSRRAPHGNELAWALGRFELGCERESYREALTDHLLALRALLEPEGPGSGLLSGRLAALCATPEHRVELTERIVRALALERTVIAGAGRPQAGERALATDVVANHLRALLRDVICGHLDPNLVALADQLLLEEELELEQAETSIESSREQVPGDASEAREVLDVLVQIRDEDRVALSERA